jgi:DNA modification methylase
VVDGKGVVRAGNGTLEAAARAGVSEVVIVDPQPGQLVAVRRGDWSPTEATAYSIADNRTGELATWDQQGLAEQLRSLQSEDFELAAIGFEPAEIDGTLEQLGDQVLGSLAEDPGPQIDRADELLKKWKVQPGQLWRIPSEVTPGKEHRLLCGDSTGPEDVARVMDGEKAGLMNTDPPYGVAYANDDRPHPGVAKPRVANDELTDSKLQNFLEAAFVAASAHALLKNAAWYMWHAHLTQGYFAAAAAAAAAAADVVLHRQIIWVKPVLLLGRGHYHWKHEPCFMGWVQGHQPPDYGLGNGERTQTTVWEIGSVTQAERKEFSHSTPKPVELFAIPMVKHLKAGELAYDPFAGSGPQFVAAEQTGRLCRGIEIVPKYCAVILERLAGMGLEPELSTASSR